jgi:F-type H+-transporting ATPase subunit a
MDVRIFGELVLFRVGAFPVTRTMVTSLAISALLLAAVAALGRGVRLRPESMPAALALLLVEWLDDLVTEVAGRRVPALVMLAGSLFLFVASANLSGLLPGVHRPTASLAATSALACVVFLAVPIAGVRARGLGGYLKEYLRPNPLLLPLHLVAEVSRTVALSVRLFGNMMSGQLIAALLVSLAGFLIPTPIMLLDLLIGLLQAYIFTVLATVYVGAAIRTADPSASP